MFSTQYEKVEQAPALKYTPPKPFLQEKHTCTDPLCFLVFTLCLGFTSYVMMYAFQHGDPRKVYHGMDWQSNLCGVDLPTKPYVYWCPTTSANPGLAAMSPLADLDFHHPICVANCPEAATTQSECYDSSTGKTHLVTDYATHPIAHRYCLPQSPALLKKYNDKMDGHAISKYLPEVITSIRKAWPVLLGAAGLAFVLSMTYLLMIECLAGCVMWMSLLSMVAIPGACGSYLIYANFHGGIDGMPGSGDAKTDLYLGIFSCAVCGLFLLIVCCMVNAVNRAIRVMEASAACLFSCRSLLLEPLFNLTARIGLWLLMGGGLMYLISVGDVRKSKIYRTFTYTTEENIYIGFFVLMFIWLNDYINAVSQFVLANASARWYFTEHSGSGKAVGSCLLCKGYCNVLFHIGSLAFGSLIIALTRPLRIVLLAVVYTGEMTDNAACGCLSAICGCCIVCFDSMVQHLSKNAYIDMAITSKSFCASASNAARLLSPKNQAGGKAIFANLGATWLFTISGLGSVTAAGSLITACVVLNVDTFNKPEGRYFVQDPMVMTFLSGVLCFIVALCFMLVFDSVADTLFLCMAYDFEEEKQNPVPNYHAAPQEPPQNLFSSMFHSEKKVLPPQAVKRPQYADPKLTALVK